MYTEPILYRLFHSEQAFAGSWAPCMSQLRDWHTFLAASGMVYNYKTPFSRQDVTSALQMKHQTPKFVTGGVPVIPVGIAATGSPSVHGLDSGPHHCTDSKTPWSVLQEQPTAWCLFLFP